MQPKADHPVRTLSSRHGALLSLILFLTTVTPGLRSYGQDTLSKTALFPDTLCKGRFTGVLITQGALYAGILTGLSVLYYQNSEQVGFRFFDDNSSWLQMDKAGHVFSTYYMSSLMHFTYRYAGLRPSRAVLYGSLLAWTFQLNIEILDGLSSKWGFSWGDIAANTAGCLLFAGQQLGWKEQRLTVKYSYHPTGYPEYNPVILGSTWLENIWEDYNGMTFWLSGNISSFLPKSTRIPKWLNVAFGYGGEGLAVSPDQFLQYRQFYFSLDVDLNRIPVRSKPLKALFAIVNLIKIPFPTIEYNTLGQFRFHYLYF